MSSSEAANSEIKSWLSWIEFCVFEKPIHGNALQTSISYKIPVLIQINIKLKKKCVNEFEGTGDR